VLLSAASFARNRHGEFGLFRRPKVPSHIPELAADSGGFVAARRLGEYDFLAIQYIEWLCSVTPSWQQRWTFQWSPSWRATRGPSATARSALLRWPASSGDQYPDTAWAWVPTIQGWSVEDYVRHAQDLRPLVMEMRREYNPWSWDREDPEGDALAARKAEAFRAGVGTLCRRASPQLIRDIVQAVADVLTGVPLHLWGVKVSTLQSAVELPANVVSVDSAAWNGRFGRDIERARLEQNRMRLSQREHGVRVALPRYIRRVEDALLAPKQLSLDVGLARAV
jgi:hypothetical protein